MKRVFYLVLSNIFIAVQIFAQVETTNLIGIASGSGTATHTYAMTDAGRVKNGAFKVVKTMTDPETAGSSYKLTISGSYKNDLPDGTWTYSLSTVQFPTLGSSYSTGSITLTQHWTNGVANGTWTYAKSRSFKKKNVNFRSGTYTWSEPFKNADDTKNSTITFKNGVIQLTTGTFDGSKITCQNGVPVEFYESLGNGNYISQTIKNGIATEKGNNYTRKNYEISYTEEQEKYLLEHRDSLIELCRGGRTMENAGIGVYKLGAYVPREFFGDEFADNNWQYEIPRKYIEANLKPYEYITFDFEVFEKSKEAVRKEAEKQKELREKQRAEEQARAENKKYQELYDKLYSQLKEYIKETPLNCQKPSIDNPTIGGIDIIYSTLLSHYRKYQAPEKYYEEKYKITDFSPFGYNPNYKHTSGNYGGNNTFKPIETIKESYEKLDEQINFMISKQDGKDSINNLLCLCYDIVANAYKIDKSYITNLENTGTNSFSSGIPKSVRKPKLYFPYFKTLNYLVNNVTYDKSFSEYYKSIKEINSLCEFILTKDKPKELEKELSATKDVQEWIEIFRKYMQK